eukprot:15278741-Heterocapsa_arctica.AAC.1
MAPRDGARGTSPADQRQREAAQQPPALLRGAGGDFNAAAAPDEALNLRVGNLRNVGDAKAVVQSKKSKVVSGGRETLGSGRIQGRTQAGTRCSPDRFLAVEPQTEFGVDL